MVVVVVCFRLILVLCLFCAHSMPVCAYLVSWTVLLVLGHLFTGWPGGL